MAFISWHDDFATGIEIVDTQHQRLIDIINDAAPVLLEADPAKDYLRQKLFTELVEYTQEHFRTEEQLMAAEGVHADVLAHHQKTHAKLVHDVAQWSEQLTSRDPLSGQNLLGFLAGWLLFHVLGEDQTMARQIRARHSGLNSDEALERGEGRRRAPKDETLERLVSRLFTQLSGQVREIALRNAHLEEMVKSRTADLEEATQELRVAHDAAQSASQAKSRFLATISHELRTPLNAIVGLTPGLVESDDRIQREKLAQRTLGATHQLQNLVETMIEFSAAEAGHSSMFRLQKMLQESCEGAFTLAYSKGVDARIHVAPEVGGVWEGDKLHISQIMAHLSTNAAKFTDFGRIVVRAEACGHHADGRALVRLSVQDTGIGIDPARQHEAFEPFHQLDNGDDRKYAGLGLGLPLIRRMAHLLDSEIHVWSALEKGSRFWLDLPLRPGVEAAVPPSAPLPHSAPIASVPTPPRRPVRATPEHTALMRELEQYLAQDDTRASDLSHIHGQALQEALGAEFAQILALIQDFDYPKALRLLRGIIARGANGPHA